MPRPQYVSDAITVDGSGLHVGEYEDLALYAAYQPIYARAGGCCNCRGSRG